MNAVKVPDSNGQSVCISLPIEPRFEAEDSGILYDYCHGLRVKFPSEGGPWHLTITDADAGTILFDEDVPPKAFVTTKKKYYVRFDFEIRDHEGNEVFSSELDLRGELVAIFMPVQTIGDTFAWFPYIEEFRKKHGCNIIAALHEKFIPLFKRQYPDITFLPQEKVMARNPYACYYVGLYWDDDVNQPCDHRLVGLHKTAAYILGLDAHEEHKPLLNLTAPRRIKKPYVCIASQATCMSKCWVNPVGWMEVVEFLKDSGYRVLCMDREKVQGVGINYTTIPYGVEDYSGDFPLQERINVIKHADFFVGLASGLSWLAWACNVPVVLISGFSHPLTEFYTAYRVINYHACNSCWNDVRFNFDHHDWLWCPRHKNTDRQFECMRMISGKQVIDAIKRIPTYKSTIPASSREK